MPKTIILLHYIEHTSGIEYSVYLPSGTENTKSSVTMTSSCCHWKGMQDVSKEKCKELCFCSYQGLVEVQL